MKSIAEQQQQKIWSIEQQSHFHLIFDPFLILNLENLVLIWTQVEENHSQLLRPSFTPKTDGLERVSC